MPCLMGRGLSRVLRVTLPFLFPPLLRPLRRRAIKTRSRELWPFRNRLAGSMSHRMALTRDLVVSFLSTSRLTSLNPSEQRRRAASGQSANRVKKGNEPRVSPCSSALTLASMMSFKPREQIASARQGSSRKELKSASHCSQTLSIQRVLFHRRRISSNCIMTLIPQKDSKALAVETRQNPAESAWSPIPRAIKPWGQINFRLALIGCNHVQAFVRVAGSRFAHWWAAGLGRKEVGTGTKLARRVTRRKSPNWSQRDSNSRPSACHADALPTAPWPREVLIIHNSTNSAMGWSKRLG